MNGIQEAEGSTPFGSTIFIDSETGHIQDNPGQKDENPIQYPSLTDELGGVVNCARTDGEQLDNPSRKEKSRNNPGTVSNTVYNKPGLPRPGEDHGQGQGLTGQGMSGQGPGSAVLDADLSLVVDKWNDLPEAVRAGIVAMVKASKKS